MTIFTQVVSNVPSITNIVSDTQGDFTSFNRGVDQRSVFLSLLDSYRTDGFDVELLARGEIRNVTIEGFRQQSVMEVVKDERRVNFSLDKRTSVGSELHTYSLRVVAILSQDILSETPLIFSLFFASGPEQH